METIIHDEKNRAIGHYDPAGYLRNDNGKIVAHEVAQSRALHLSDLAARFVMGRPAPLAQDAKGKLVLLDLAQGDVVPATATRAAFALDTESGFIADQVSNVRKVGHDRGNIFVEDTNDALKLPLAVSVSGGAAPAECAPGFIPQSFVCTGYGLAARLPHRMVANADMDLLAIALRILCNRLRRAREARIAKLLTTSGNWASANVVAVGAAKWNGGTTPDPLANLYSALAASSVPADTLILPEPVEPFFFSSTATTNRVQNARQAGLDLPRILVAKAKSMVAGTPTYQWAPALPSSAVLVKTAKADTDVSTCTTLRWNGWARDGAEVEGVLVRRYREVVNGDQVDTIAVLHADVDVLLSNTAGALLSAAIS